MDDDDDEEDESDELPEVSISYGKAWTPLTLTFIIIIIIVSGSRSDMSARGSRYELPPSITVVIFT